VFTDLRRGSDLPSVAGTVVVLDHLALACVLEIQEDACEPNNANNIFLLQHF
jgi:hypothetical protein